MYSDPSVHQKIMNLRNIAKNTIASATFFASCAAIAAPWAVVANSGSGAAESGIYTIDFGTTSPSVFGPHLVAGVGIPASDGLYDVTVAPNGQFALASDFTKKTVYRINLSDPKKPTFVASIPTPDMFAEDIDISPDGRWAIVSDGGFSKDLYFVDLTNNTSTKFTLSLTPDVFAQAVKISPNGRTVLMIDYFGSKIVYGDVNSTHDSIVNLKSLPLPLPLDLSNPGPVNLTVNQNGNLVLVAAAGSKQIVPYTATGSSLTVGTPINLPAAPQSIVFSPTESNRAYALLSAKDTPPTAPPRVVELDVSGGALSLTGRSVDTQGTGSSQLFGVDTLAISSDGRILIATNTTFSGASTAISKIDTKSFGALPIELNNQFPGGVDFIPLFMQSIPTLSQWAMALLVLLMLGVLKFQKSVRRAN
jgi:WD40 repeat protein